MQKKILVALVSIVSIITIIIIFQMSQTTEPQIQKTENIEIDVSMPTKVSRPGCDATDSCYVPSKITKNVNDSVTWLNDDSAFHSVTSGTYDNPDTLFDSGHIDPNSTFTFTFKNEGTYDYFCTLHPWMKGIVIVK